MRFSFYSCCFRPQPASLLTSEGVHQRFSYDAQPGPACQESQAFCPEATGPQALNDTSSSTLRRLLSATQAIALLRASPSHAMYKAVTQDGRIVTIGLVVGDNTTFMELEKGSLLVPHPYVCGSTSVAVVLKSEDLDEATYLRSQRYGGAGSMPDILDVMRPESKATTLGSLDPTTNFGLNGNTCAVSYMTAQPGASPAPHVNSSGGHATATSLPAAPTPKSRGLRGAGSGLLGSFSRSRLWQHAPQPANLGPGNVNISIAPATGSLGLTLSGGGSGDGNGSGRVVGGGLGVPRVLLRPTYPSQPETPSVSDSHLACAKPNAGAKTPLPNSSACSSTTGFILSPGFAAASAAVATAAALPPKATVLCVAAAAAAASATAAPTLSAYGAGVLTATASAAVTTSESCAYTAVSAAYAQSQSALILPADGPDRSTYSTSVSPQVPTPAISVQNPRPHTMSSFLSGGTTRTAGVEEADRVLPGTGGDMVMISGSALQTGSGFFPGSGHPSGSAAAGSANEPFLLHPHQHHRPQQQTPQLVAIAGGGRAFGLVPGTAEQQCQRISAQAAQLSQGGGAALSYEAGMLMVLQWLRSIGAQPGKKLRIKISDWCDAGNLQQVLALAVPPRPSQRDNGLLSSHASLHAQPLAPGGGIPGAPEGAWLAWSAADVVEDPSPLRCQPSGGANPNLNPTSEPPSPSRIDRPRRSITLDALTYNKETSMTPYGCNSTAPSSVRSMGIGRGTAGCLANGGGGAASAAGDAGAGAAAVAVAVAPLVPKLSSGLWRALSRRAAHVAALRCALQIAQGLAHIHNSGYYHANLNPTTIYCSRLSPVSLTGHLPLPTAAAATAAGAQSSTGPTPLRWSPSGTAPSGALAASHTASFTVPSGAYATSFTAAPPGPLATGPHAASFTAGQQGSAVVPAADTPAAAEAAAALEVLVTAAPLGRIACKVSISNLVPIIAGEGPPAAPGSAAPDCPAAGASSPETAATVVTVAVGEALRSGAGGPGPLAPHERLVHALRPQSGPIPFQSSSVGAGESVRSHVQSRSSQQPFLELSLNTAQWRALAYVAPEVVANERQEEPASQPELSPQGVHSQRQEQGQEQGQGQGQGQGQTPPVISESDAKARSSPGSDGTAAGPRGSSNHGASVPSPGTSTATKNGLPPSPSCSLSGPPQQPSPPRPLPPSQPPSHAIAEGGPKANVGRHGGPSPPPSVMAPSRGAALSCSAPCPASDALQQRGAAACWGPAANAFTFGMILHQLVTGRIPYYDLHPAQILVGKATGDLERMLEWPEECEPELRRLGEGCLSREPERRPGMDEAAAVLEAVLGRVSGQVREALRSCTAAEAALFVSGRLR